MIENDTLQVSQEGNVPKFSKMFFKYPLINLK